MPVVVGEEVSVDVNVVEIVVVKLEVGEVVNEVVGVESRQVANVPSSNESTALAKSAACISQSSDVLLMYPPTLHDMEPTTVDLEYSSMI